MSSAVQTLSAELQKSGSSDIFQNVTGILKETFPRVNIEDIPGFSGDGTNVETGTNFAVFMFSLIFGMFWVTYITFFNSREVGAIVTKIANKFVKEGHVKVRIFMIFPSPMRKLVFVRLHIQIRSTYLSYLILINIWDVHMYTILHR